MIEQEPPHEHHGRVELEVGITFLREAVAFIPGHQVPHRLLVLLHALDHLLGFAERHARIVAALHHEERVRNLLRVVDRRGLVEEAAIFGSRSSPYSTRRRSRR